LVINNSNYGIIGFSHIQGHWYWDIIVVKGKRCFSIPVPYPIYKIVYWIWRKKLAKKG